MVAWITFLLAFPLGSIVSAVDCSTLFDNFIATLGNSDFSESFIIGYDSASSRCGPWHDAMVDSEISRFPDKERVRMPAPTTTQS